MVFFSGPIKFSKRPPSTIPDALVLEGDAAKLGQELEDFWLQVERNIIPEDQASDMITSILEPHRLNRTHRLNQK